MSTGDKTLQFDKPVVLSGPCEFEFGMLSEMISRSYPVIGADGGANTLLKHAIVPDAIIGDFDSVDPLLVANRDITLIKLEEQDSTDFEKCLYSVSAPLFLAFGFIGKRFDHTLANLHTMVKYHREKNILLIGPEDVSFIARGNFQFSGMVGQFVSIFPVEPVCFERSSGLEYPLNGLEMAMGGRIGASNVMTGEQFDVIPTPQSADTPYMVSFPLHRLDDLIVYFSG